MADQAERVILEAEDMVTPVVAQANAGLDNFEKKAESAHGKVIRITDQTRTSIQRLIASLEKQAEVYGKSGVDRLISQRDQLLQRYAKEPQAIDAITKSYERMIAEQKKMDSEAKFEAFGGKVKQFIQAPLQGAQGAMGEVVSGMGAMGVALGVGAAAMGAIAVAGFAAAKSLGEYGMEIKNVELRTGMTSKEVGQFGFAARMAGQDVSIFERMMRGLSQAADEQSKEGAKARATLQGLGVDLRSITGEARPTADVIRDIAGGLAKLPEGFERDAAAMGLFKRAGIEAIPVIAGLTDNIRRAKELGLGATDEDMKRWEKYHEAVTEAEVLWERFTRKIKEPLAALVTILFKDQAGHQYSLEDLQKRGVNLGQFAPRTAAGDREAARAAGFNNPQMDEWNRNIAMDALLGFTGKIEDRKRADAAVLAYQGSEGLAGQLKQAEGALSALAKPEVGTTSLAELNTYREAEGHVASLKAQIAAQKKGVEDLAAARRAAAEFEKGADESELSAIDKIYYARDKLLLQLQKTKAAESELAAVRAAADEKVTGTIKKDLAFILEAEQKPLGPRMGGDAEAERNSEGWSRAFDRESEIGIQARKATLQRGASRALRMSEMSGMPEAEAIRTAFQVRIGLAVELAGIEQERIDRELKGSDKLVAEAELKRDVEKEAAEAMEEAQLKQLELLHKQTEEIKGTASGLFHTLFTKPGDFPRQLGSTVRDAALKPITEGLGGTMATFLQPLIHGQSGEGGIGGILRGVGAGTQDPVTTTLDNTAATKQNSNALWLLTAVLSESIGRGMPAMAAAGSTVPNMGMASPSGFLTQVLRNTGGLPRFAEGGVTSGPTIVGEAGPELVIPLSPEIDAMRRQASVLRGPDPPDPSLRYRGILGLLRESYPGVADWIGNTASKIWNDPGLRMLPGPMALEIEGEELAAEALREIDSPKSVAKAIRDAQRGGRAWEKGDAFFDKSSEELKVLGAKGGRRKLTPAQHADLIDRMNYSSKYEGPEPGIPELTHDASAKIDAANPRLRDAFKLTEEEKIARAVQQASGRAGGLARAANREASVRAPRDIAAMRVRGSDAGAMLWAINPKTGGIRLSQYIPDKLTAVRDDLFATHADWFEKIGFPVAGEEFDKVPRGYARIDKGAIRIIDNGMEEEQEGLTSPPLTDAQYEALNARIGKRFKLPGYAEGGTVGSTGTVVVHQGEAVVPQADTLKRSIDALTFEMHSNTGVLGWFVNSMVSPMLGGRAPSLPVPIPGIGTVTIPSLFGGGSGGGGGAAASGASGGYSPVGGYSPAGGGRGGVQIPLGLGSAAGGGSRIPGSGFSPHAMLASIKGTDWGGFTRPTVHEFDEQGFATGETHKGGITGMHGVAGAAAFAGGTMLAQRGLMGQDMGTWGGVAEGAGGGAAIGFTYGGPLGAAIGAGVGFGIGVGEKIAGVKSPAREAHDDIKAAYGIDIPPNSGTVKQVVELAKSQFGGSISVAVRSPSVRQLVMLYSEATGQKMPLSAATPYAGSLVEQGGSLYQQASFQNNSWNTYASNLPTLGGIVGGTYPTPGAGGTTIALNINGQPITPEFVTDQSMAAQGASYGRTQQAANMQVPGLMVA